MKTLFLINKIILITLMLYGCQNEDEYFANYGYHEIEKNSNLINTSNKNKKDFLENNFYKFQCVETDLLIVGDILILHIGGTETILKNDYNKVIKLYLSDIDDIQPMVIIKRGNKYYSKSSKVRYPLKEGIKNYKVDLKDDDLEIKPVK